MDNRKIVVKMAVDIILRTWNQFYSDYKYYLHLCQQKTSITQWRKGLVNKKTITWFLKFFFN